MFDNETSITLMYSTQYDGDLIKHILVCLLNILLELGMIATRKGQNRHLLLFCISTFSK